MPEGLYIGAYASLQTEDGSISAWEVYWIVPWPLGKTTVVALQKRLLRQTADMWNALRIAFEEYGLDLQHRVTTMKLQVRSKRPSDTAIAIRHRAKDGRPTMSFKPVFMNYFGRKSVDRPPAPQGYPPFYGAACPLPVSLTIDHDTFGAMLLKTRGDLTVRQRINGAHRLGARVRYRISPGKRGRHVMVCVKKTMKPNQKFELRELLADDGARIFLDRERYRQLPGEPARSLRPSGVLWDTRRPFDPLTLALGPVERAGRWYAWKRRGALRKS